MLKAVGRHIYDLDVDAEVIEINKNENGNETSEHVTFRFFTRKRTLADVPTPTSEPPPVESLAPTCDVTLMFPPRTIVLAKDFCNIFPFHVAFNKDLALVQCGTKVQVRPNESTRVISMMSWVTL